MSTGRSGGQAGVAQGADAAPAADVGTHRQRIAELFAEHNRSLHVFLMTRLGDEQEAREVAQSAYVQLLQLEQPGAISFLRAYLFKAASNIAINRARERSNRARLLKIGFDEGAVDELSPDRYTLGDEDMATFRLALAELPEKCSRAFLLCRVEGQGDEDIALQLGVKPRMVRYYLAQAGAYCQLRISGLSAEQAKAAIR